MKSEELREELSIELEWMNTIICELISVKRDVNDREPTLREKTAAAAFLAQFYNGIENILKRISRFHGIEIPQGETWHVELFKRFCQPVRPPFPGLFDEQFALELAPYRKFRHIVHHGYGFQIEWKRMKDGLDKVEIIFSHFRSLVTEYLETLES